MGVKNPVTHFGKPLVAMLLGWATLFGLLFGFAGEAFRSDHASLLAVLYLHWVVISYLIWLAMEFRSNAFSSPPVKSVRIDDGIIIVGHRDWLGISVAVLVFKQEGEFERFVCSGTVINVQKNGLVQIAIDTGEIDQSEVETVRTKLTDGEHGSLIVKPGRARET